MLHLLSPALFTALRRPAAQFFRMELVERRGFRTANFVHVGAISA
jgi:hypothetical protein